MSMSVLIVMSLAVMTSSQPTTDYSYPIDYILDNLRADSIRELKESVGQLKSDVVYLVDSVQRLNQQVPEMMTTLVSVVESVKNLKQEVNDVRSALVSVAKYVDDMQRVNFADSFRPMTFPNGSATCALDKPSSVVPVPFVVAGFFDGEFYPNRCAMLCKGMYGCKGFNYRNSTETIVNGGQCEFYSFSPGRCDRTDMCQHYQLNGLDASCKPTAEFTQLSGNTYYKPIFEPLSWGDSTRRCLQLSPFAHLVIIESLEEFQQLQFYVRTIPADSLNACKVQGFPQDFGGYWTAKRRHDVYATSKEDCMSSPFVWIKDNTTRGQLAEQSWESEIWLSGSPDCMATSANDIDTCVGLQVVSSATTDEQCKLTDLNCWIHPLCPLCELNIN